MRDVLREHTADALEHLRDVYLVVGAEDRAAGVPHDAVLDNRAQLAARRNRVEMGAEEERRPVGRRLYPREDICRTSPRRARDPGPRRYRTTTSAWAALARGASAAQPVRGRAREHQTRRRILWKDSRALPTAPPTAHGTLFGLLNGYRASQALHVAAVLLVLDLLANWTTTQRRTRRGDRRATRGALPHPSCPRRARRARGGGQPHLHAHRGRPRPAHRRRGESSRLGRLHRQRDTLAELGTPRPQRTER